MIKENEVLLSSCEDFDDYCLRTFDVFLGGDVFPYRLSDTYRLVYDTWEEAVQELMAHGIEGFSYQRDEEVDDYLMCMQGFTQHVLMHDTTLQLVAQFCNTTYKLLMYNFDVPIRFETRIVKGEYWSGGTGWKPVEDEYDGAYRAISPNEPAIKGLNRLRAFAISLRKNRQCSTLRIHSPLTCMSAESVLIWARVSSFPIREFLIWTTVLHQERSYGRAPLGIRLK